MNLTFLYSIGISAGLIIVFLTFFFKTNIKSAKRITTISSTVLAYRETHDSLWNKFQKKTKVLLFKVKNKKPKARANKTDNILEVLKQPGNPLSIGYKEYKTIKDVSPFIFAILLGFSGITSRNFILIIWLAFIGFFVGLIIPKAVLLYLYRKYKDDLTNELSEAMTYIIDFRKAGQTITDSIKGAIFSTNKLKPQLEKLLQDISISGPRIALAKLSKETDVEEFKNFADILMQSITIDSTNMVAYMASRASDIDYIEGLKEVRRYKNKKMVLEALTTIPFIMIPLIILVPLLMQANQSLSNVM